MCDYLEDCGCILAGGETAEMPGIVPEDVVELSGFCIGCCEKPDLIDPTQISTGDVLIGYRSDGPHANGWSLIRRVLAQHGDAFTKEEIVSLLANLERLLPNHGADVVIPNWENPAMHKVFEYVDAEDKFHTFNMGFGWVAIVAPEDVEQALAAGSGGVQIGTISDNHGVRVSMES